MLKIISVLFLFIASEVSSWSDNQLDEKPKYMEHIEGCYFHEIDDVVPFNGTLRFPGYCYVMQCNPDRIVYTACGIVLTDEVDCDIKYIRFAASYPACCYEIKCLRDRISPEFMSRIGVFTWGNRDSDTKRSHRMHARFRNYMNLRKERILQF